MTPEQVLDGLAEVGWLDQLPEAKRASLPDELRQWHERNPEWAYLALATGGFDAEMIEDDDSYPSVLDSYREASGGAFDPQNVESTAEYDDVATVAFDLSGRRFEVELPFEDDYVSEEFEPFLNQALGKCGIERRFFTLPAIDQICYVVFVTPKVYNLARRKGIIPAEG